jgi:hypothetical protein
MFMAKSRNPLEPAATVVQTMLLLWLVLAAITVVSGSGSVLGFGQGELCVQAASGLSRVAADAVPTRDGVRAEVSEIRYCAQQPTGGQRMDWALTTAPSALLYLVLLLLALRLIWGANRRGLYTAETAGRLRVLGWFLLVGGVVASIVEAVARVRFLDTVVSYQPHVEATWLQQWDMSIWVVLIACVLLSFARITRIGNTMRKDLEGTV